MSQNTIFILGAGPRIGWSVAEKFKAEGYKVAIGSRRPDIVKVRQEGFLPVSVDLGSVQRVEEAFEKVTKELGVPNVVVYNAANLTFPSEATDPFGSVTSQAFKDDTAVNVTGAFVSMQESLKGFKSLSAEGPKVFIATGNVLPFYPSPIGFTLGAGKASLTHLINVGVQVYSSQNFRFYFASQVTAEGNAVQYPDVNGATHGLIYWDLVNRKEQGDWDVRFLGDGTVVAPTD